MHARSSILALSLLAAVAATANAGDKAAVKAKHLTQADCEKLVEQLVNPEKPPFKQDYLLDPSERLLRHAKTFRRIGEAYDTLSRNAAVALPVLMKHVDDRRYSFVQEQPGSGVLRKVSVGWACTDIVYEHVEAHLKKTFCHDGEGRFRGYRFINHCGGLDEWWKTRKGKGLAELQLEAMEWVLKQEKPKAFKSEAAWKEALKGVREMADTIRKTRKPVAVDHRFYAFSR